MLLDNLCQCESRLSKTAIVIQNRKIADDIYAMVLSAPDLAASTRPGQFFMFMVDGGKDLFLRRPFSVAGISPEAGTVQIIYQITGKGTTQMARWEAGREIDVLGPLGNGFSWDDTIRRVVLVGGGMGIAPLLPLAGELRASGIEVSAFAGAKRMDLFFGLSQWIEYGCQVQIATEDGSGGVRGFVTLPLEEHLKRHFGPSREQSGRQRPDMAQNMLFACGPAPFLQAVTGLCESYQLKAQLSHEERMGCGFGACMGCSIPVKSGDGGLMQKRVCCDGPVFAAGEVIDNG